MTLANMIAAKLKELDLSPTAGAEKAGLAYPAFATALAGESLPNARTVKKYARFLGVGTEVVAKLVETAKGSKPKGKRRGRPPGAKNKRAARGKVPKMFSLQAAVHLAADELAVQVHDAPEATRQVLKAVMGAG